MEAERWVHWARTAINEGINTAVGYIHSVCKVR